MADHLPNCNCAGPTRHDRRDLSAALGHLLVVLRAQGAILPPTVGIAEVEAALLRYDQYMEHVRSLAPNTRDMALHLVDRLLAGGTSLKEVADVLRHRSLNTAMIDAKLDS